ncbi:hypothetical protein [Rhodanobacter sp. FW106-PBR-LB-2-11]|uniref:hypothetical protein n=1 Tax=Rhodanobacter sp. FW106-PBR-LB-2-11 TaxID=1524463 RepID=UPI0034E5C309
MSYCRFSSDQYACDVYVYAGIGGGFVTHVARQRFVFEPPLPPPVAFEESNIDAFVRHAAEVQSRVDQAPREPIDLPHAGETFDDPDAAACAKRLCDLRALGYRVPQDAIDALTDEAIAEGAS